jgi:pimeloyl-ACP methyl ester carboxylesterase
MQWPAYALALVAGLAAGPARAAESVATVATRPGVSVRAVVVESSGAPSATLILFAGGDGRIRIPEDGVTETWALERGNFLVRTRRMFAAQGFLVIVPDVASDRSGLTGARIGDAHVADMQALIAFARARAPKSPVWLVGTSMGTVSAAHGAASLGSEIAGLVLTSPVTEDSAGRRASDEKVPQARLGVIAVPTLVLSHRDDGCHMSPPAGARALEGLLAAAKPVVVETIEGGLPPQSEPCQAMSAHGYLGVEREAVDAITRFVRTRGVPS